jgi:oligopeptide transport system substrate-binding protein
MPRSCSFFLLSAFGALALAACGGEPGGEWIGRVRPPGQAVLRVAVGEDPAGLDPTHYASRDAWRVARLLFEGLTTLDTGGRARPGVAERWESDAGAVHWTFHLRADARWSDSEPVTAGDFVLAWRRVLEPAGGSETAEYLYPVRGAEEVNRGQIPPERLAVTAVDARTLGVVLTAPDPDFPVRAALPPFFPLPAHLMTGGVPDRPAGEDVVGNGPFRLEQWQANNRLEVRRSVTYWDRDAIALEGVVLFPLEDPATALNLYRTGALDWTTANTIPMDEARRFLAQGSSEACAVRVFHVNYLEVNTRRPPTDDVRVRRALELSLPRERIARDLHGTGQRAQRTFTVPDLPGWTPPEPPAGEAAGARPLLAEAGYPDGAGLPPLVYLYNVGAANAAVAEYLQGYWRRELGVRLELVPMDFASMEERGQRGDFHLKRSGWLADLPDPLAFLTVFEGDNPNNPTGWHSAPYDTLLARARRTAGPAERMRLLQEAESLLLADAAVLPILQSAAVQLVKPYVTGITPNALDVVDWKTVRLDTAWRPPR